MPGLIRFYTAVAIMTLAAPAAANEFDEACREFGSAEVIFIGRATSAPITRRFSGEQEIEKARIVSDAAERDMKAFEALKMPPEIGGGRLVELAIRAVKAREEYNRTRAMHPPPFDLSLTPLLVETPFRGVATNELLAVNRGPALDLSRSYVIYADRQRLPFAPDLIALRRTIDLEAAEAHLQFLNDAANDSGTVVHGALSIEDPDDPQRRTPLGGVVLRLSLDGQRYETSTGADGKFLVTGVPPGVLRIDPVLPEHLTLTRQSTGVTMRGGCMAVNMLARVNGRIRGRVMLDTGAPFRGLVDVVGDEPKLKHMSRSPERTNEQGEFAFSALPPGRYLVGVNIARQPTAGAPFLPTYFPGTTDRSQATPLLVGPETGNAALEWIVGPRLREGSIDVSFDTHGQPQKEMGVCFTVFDADLLENGGGGYGPRPNGLVSIPVVEGVRYRLSAYAQLPSGFAESETFDVIGAAGRQTIKLRLASVSEKATGIRCGSSGSRQPFSPSR